MEKAFSNFTWEDLPSTNTPINATNLNKINTGLNTVDDRVITLDTQKQDESSVSLDTDNKHIVPAINEVNREASKLDRRVTNLEGRAPASSVISYPDTTYGEGDVPSNVCKYANLQKVKGKTIKWNQIVSNGNFESGEGWGSSNATCSVSNNELHYLGRLSNSSSPKLIATIIGHIYMLMCDVKLTTPTTLVGILLQQGTTRIYTTATIEKQTLAGIRTAVRTGASMFLFDQRSSDWDEVIFSKCMCLDLTEVYGSGNEPSTVAEVLADFPELNSYCAYDAGSLKSETVTGAWSKDVDDVALDSKTFPSTLTLRGDDTDDDEYVPETGVVTRKQTTQTVTGAVGDTITLTGCDTSATSYLCGKGDIGTLASGVLTLTVAVTNEPVQYKLATATTESVTALDPYIEVEAEGTVGLTHTESPVTDSVFDVEYANLTASS